jgi:hypothetical protein
MPRFQLGYWIYGWLRISRAYGWVEGYQAFAARDSGEGDAIHIVGVPLCVCLFSVLFVLLCLDD